MSENRLPDQNPPPALAPLDYEAPLPDWVRRRRNQWARIVGAILMAGSVFAIVFLFILVNIPDIGGMPPHQLNAKTNFIAPVIAAVTTILILGGIAFWQWKRRGSTAFAAGLLIGLGVAALIEGLCFAVLGGR